MNRWFLLPTLIAMAAVAAAADCTTCHSDKHGSLGTTPHVVLQSGDNPAAACTQCHGAAEAHLLNPFAGGVLAFGDETVTQKNEACGSCHSDAHNAGRGVHETANIACSDCHSVHGEKNRQSQLPAGFENLDAASAICADCHADVLAQFAFNNRHRLAEHSLGCTDCHNPHAERTALPAHAAVSGVCSDCHAQQDGPFVFEHDASRVDGCVACHSPHGSANRHLLKHQQVGELCFSCHAALPQFHLGSNPSAPPRFGADTVCTNCHVTIHGSNLDSKFLK